MIQQAKLESIQRMKTKIKLVFSIPAEAGDTPFEQFLGFVGYFIFQGNPIAQRIIEATKNRKMCIDEKGRTPSEKLRNKIFELHYLNGSNVTDEEHYQMWMDYFIKVVDKKITEAHAVKSGA